MSMKKLNWGHGIFIAIAVMVLTILSVVLWLTNERIDLVADDYYPKGIQYETQLIKQRNTAGLTKPVSIELSDSLWITFPDDFSLHDSIKGEIWFYKASDKREDYRYQFMGLSSHKLSFPLNRFANGRYELIIDWRYLDKDYYFKESIYIEKE